MRETTAICFESLLSIVDGLRQPFNFRSLTFSSFTIVKLAAGCRPWADANLWRSQIWRFFFGPAPPLPPTEFANATLPREINFFKFGPPDPLPPPPPPKRAIRGKMWIYLSRTSIGWILIQSDSLLCRSNKEETLFFLFATNNAHHARNWSQKP